MAHYSKLNKTVIDVPPDEHDREVAFWSAALGQPPKQGEHFPEYHGIALHGQDFGFLIQRLGDGPARVHLDIHTDDLGAERVEFVHAWWIMRDPAGLLFCVVPEPDDSLNDTNAQRWD